MAMFSAQCLKGEWTLGSQLNNLFIQVIHKHHTRRLSTFLLVRKT